MTEEEILDYPARLAHYRRSGDPRYYKGVEYADVVESLARRRAAEAFAANGYTADQIYVNVQALSGAPANNAVYQALLNLGDTVMGLNLLHGGHLSHGSSVNRSGKWFKAVHYTIDDNEHLDYGAIRKLALEAKPKLIIAGYSSYSWVPDWKKFREIADEVGAYFLADISHIGGLVAAGVVPSPIGIAHVVMSTTHKSLDGPRGAVLMTTYADIAKKIDKAVFPGEQGGPHVNVLCGSGADLQASANQTVQETPSPDHQERASDGGPIHQARTACPVRRHELPHAQRGCDLRERPGVAPISPATRPRAFWISSASWSIATRFPVTRIRSIHPAFAWARRGSRNAALPKKPRVNWPT